MVDWLFLRAWPIHSPAAHHNDVAAVRPNIARAEKLTLRLQLLAHLLLLFQVFLGSQERSLDQVLQKLRAPKHKAHSPKAQRLGHEAQGKKTQGAQRRPESRRREGGKGESEGFQFGYDDLSGVPVSSTLMACISREEAKVDVYALPFRLAFLSLRLLLLLLLPLLEYYHYYTTLLLLLLLPPLYTIYYRTAYKKTSFASKQLIGHIRYPLKKLE